MDERFGPFRLLARIGRGGMAETFVAERTGPAGFVQRVCLKRVLERHERDSEIVRLFQHEARLAAVLSHPNIVSVLDFGEEHGRWWMALELVEGLDLRSLAKALRSAGRRLPLPVVIHVIREVARALDHAHCRTLPDGTPANIVHRDVSPTNVLVSYDGAIKLADFGIAKAVTGERTDSGVMKGKPAYMPPEQAMGAEVDGRTDLFALGVMFFELIAGARPYDGPTDLATLRNVEANRHPDLCTLAPDTPQVVGDLVSSLIHPDKSRRIGSAALLIDALGSIGIPAADPRSLATLAREARPPESIPAEGSLTERDLAVAPAQPRQADEAESMTRLDSPPTKQRAGTRVAVVATVFVLGLMVAAIALRRGVSREPDRAPPAIAAELTERATIAIARDGVSPRGDTEAHDGGVSDADSGASPSAPRPAQLVVSVYPWGYVWIDGESRGRAPVRAQVESGEHVIGAGQSTSRPVRTRRVTVAEGEARTLELSVVE